MTTPAGVSVIAHLPDGSQVNITEGVQALYDLVIGSMDWGSGFLTADDAAPVVHVAKTCGFRDYERAEEYVAEQAHSEEQQRFLAERHNATGQNWRPMGVNIPESTIPVPEHNHVWSSVGQCMWRYCEAKAGDEV